jgi:hypothetical protein
VRPDSMWSNANRNRREDVSSRAIDYRYGIVILIGDVDPAGRPVNRDADNKGSERDVRASSRTSMTTSTTLSSGATRPATSMRGYISMDAIVDTRLPTPLYACFAGVAFNIPYIRTDEPPWRDGVRVRQAVRDARAPAALRRADHGT